MNNLLLYVFGGIAHRLPQTRAFALKRLLYRLAGVNVGQNVKIVSSVKIYGNGNLTIGDNTWIGHETMIIVSKSVCIGSDCDIAPRVYIGDGTHVVDVNAKNVAGDGRRLPVHIGDGCWLCANTTILPGTIIGDKTIIAAGSVVKGEIPSFELWGGCIAKKIKSLI